MKRNDLVKTLIIMLSTVIATVGLALLLNLHTAPIIEANKAGAANDLLLNVIPDGVKFDELYNSENEAASKLTVLPQAIVPTGDCTDGTSGKLLTIYQETSGKGFAFRFQMSTKFSANPMEFTVGVSADGKITKVNQDSYSDSKPVGDAFVSSFTGNDSALSGVEIVVGATYSSKAIKAGVEAGLLILADNGLIQAGVKSDAQILEELISTVFNGFEKSTDEVAVSGNIITAYKHKADAGFAYIMKQEEVTYLAITNNMNVVKVYTLDEEKTSLVEVTTEKTDLAEEALLHTTNNIKDMDETAIKRFEKMFTPTSSEALNNVDVFNSIVSVIKLDVEGSIYYGFYAIANNSFDNMRVFVVLDVNGAIVKTYVPEFILGTEHFDYPFKEPADYYTQFEGKTSETFDPNSALLQGGATFSGEVMKRALIDSFSVFETITKGGNN